MSIDDDGHCDLPEGLTSLHEGAFRHWDGDKQGCSALRSIKFPSSCTEIQRWAFMRCAKLETVYFPSSLQVIGDYCFYLCAALQSFALPMSCIKIGQGCFSRCTSLTCVSIPSPHCAIGVQCFAHSGALTSVGRWHSYTHPDGTSEEATDITEQEAAATGPPRPAPTVPVYGREPLIGSWAFEQCPLLRFCSVPSETTEIGRCAFSHCTSLRSLIVPTTATLGASVFHNDISVIRMPPRKMEVCVRAPHRCSVVPWPMRLLSPWTHTPPFLPPCYLSGTGSVAPTSRLRSLLRLHDAAARSFS